jgi:pimeloyl-ACP methyl ester carboxylesterase
LIIIVDHNSRNHTTLNPATDKKYWDFSLDEFIAYDVPAVIDHVQTTTNSSKVGYIGHSQGTAIMFGLLSTQFKYNDIIEPFIALAPVTTVGYSTTPFNSLAKQYWFRKLLLMKGGKFFPDSFMRMVAKRLCAHRTTEYVIKNNRN